MKILLNSTLENELNNRYNELNRMNEVSNWTIEMEQREEVLDTEILDLQQAKQCWELENN